MRMIRPSPLPPDGAGWIPAQHRKMRAVAAFSWCVSGTREQTLCLVEKSSAAREARTRRRHSPGWSSRYLDRGTCLPCSAPCSSTFPPRAEFFQSPQAFADRGAKTFAHHRAKSEKVRGEAAVRMRFARWGSICCVPYRVDCVQQHAFCSTEQVSRACEKGDDMHPAPGAIPASHEPISDMRCPRLPWTPWPPGAILTTRALCAGRDLRSPGPSGLSSMEIWTARWTRSSLSPPGTSSGFSVRLGSQDCFVIPGNPSPEQSGQIPGRFHERK